MSSQALPDRLLSAARDRRLVPFAGAGVSMSICRDDGEPLFPNWKQLLLSGAKRLRDELLFDYATKVEAEINLGEYLEAAASVKRGLGGVFSDWIRQALNRSRSETSDGSLILPSILWELGSRLVLTTNYDRVLRWGCEQVSDLEEWSRIPPIASTADLQRPTLWHLHGIITCPTDLVFTDKDYTELYSSAAPEADKFRHMFREVLRNNTLLFVGFSFDDAYLQSELGWLQKCFSGAGGRHYLLVPDDRFKATQKQLEKLTSLQVIQYQGHGRPLQQLLTQLQQAAQPNVSIGLSQLDEGPANDPNTLDGYLDVAHRVNGQMKMPGYDQSLQIEQIWVQPRFVAQDSEIQLYKILKNRAVVIDGAAGFGKSTLARFIATVLARDRLRIRCPLGSSWQSSYFDVEPGDETQFPLLVNLRDVDPSRGVDGIFGATSPVLSGDHLAQLRPVLQRQNIAFVFDGLDEVPISQRPKLLEMLLLARRRWQQCYFFLTTRRFDISVLRNDGFMHVSLAPLSINDAERLMQHWARVLQRNQHDCDVFLEKVRTVLARAPDLKNVLHTPLSVALLCWNFFTSGRLPTNKASLYESLISWLFDSRSAQRIAAHLDISTTKRTLEVSAVLLLGGIGNQGLTASATVDALVENVSRILSVSRETVEQVIRVETSLGSCLEEVGGRVSFWHVNLRDYFAARWLLRSQLSENLGLSIEVDAAIHNPGWQEAIEIYIGLLTMEHRDLLLPLLDAIEKDGGSRLFDEIKKAALRWHVLEIAEAHGYRPSTEYRHRLRTEYVGSLRLSDTQLLSMDDADRIAAFSKPGQFDPRLGGKPSVRAKPLSSNNVTKMGRNPVTVQEFARFVRGAGYDDTKWRHHFGDQYYKYGWRAPLSWDEQKLIPNAPVTGISWHEAMAYCRWLTAELQRDSEDIIARLPTELEWTLAATGEKARAASSRGKRSVRLIPNAPVGIFPEHRGPYGHDDMSGLVWEWLGQVDAGLGGRNPRRRIQITSILNEDRLEPVKRRARGPQRSSLVGFRIAFDMGKGGFN
jgi:SIR2-like domain/Sulfatase-modifying factor enzyme 1